MASRVLVVHPWLPRYRDDFFPRAIEALHKQDVELDVVHGTPPPEVLARGDAIKRDWALELPTRYYSLLGRTVAYRALPSLKPYDLVILEQANRNIENYIALLKQQSRSVRVAFWGHGRTYTRPHHPVEERIKQVVTRRAHWFFSYTQGGADHVISNGFDGSRVTVLGNTVDTFSLERARKQVQQSQIAKLRKELRLQEGPTCLFIGGLDESKRLDFLLRASTEVAKRIPGFSLIIAGDGDLRDYVNEAAVRHSWLTYVGHVASPQRKAVLAAASRLLLMPGRVGLVAVESFALGLPIATTRWVYHAPEFEYLDPGRNSVLSLDDAAHYADLIVETLNDPPLLDKLRTSCAEDLPLRSLDGMVARFSEGVVASLADS